MKYLYYALFIVLFSSSCASRQNSDIRYKTKTLTSIHGDTGFIKLKVKFNRVIYFQYIYNYYWNPAVLKSADDNGSNGVIYLLSDSIFVPLGKIDSTCILIDPDYFSNLLQNYHGLLKKGQYITFQFRMHSKFLTNNNPQIFYIRIRDLLSEKVLVIISNKYKFNKSK